MRIGRFISPATARAERPLRGSVILCALLGIGAGFCNGLLGAAGGILLVAILPHLSVPRILASRGADGADVALLPGHAFGEILDERDILATALAVMLPISLISGIFYWIGGIRPAWGLVSALALPSLAGGLVGAYLLGKLPAALLRRLFAALVVVSGLRMLL